MNAVMRGLAFGLVAAGLALLVACVATVLPPIAAEQTAQGPQGAVVLRMVTTVPQAQDRSPGVVYIGLRKQRTASDTNSVPETYYLQRSNPLTNSTLVFSGMLPPGKYWFAGFSERKDARSLLFPNAAFGFEVREHQVTMLGTLLVRMPTANESVEMAYVPPDAEQRFNLRQLFPGLASQVAAQAPLTMTPTPSLNAAAERAEQFRGLGRITNAQMTANGDFYAGGRFGSVFWLPRGEPKIRIANVDRWDEVVSVRPLRNGLLVAGEEGLLQHSPDGRNWRILTPPDHGLIAAAEPLTDGKVVAVVRRQALWSAYLSDDIFGGVWQKLGDFHFDAASADWENPPVIVRMGRQVGVMTRRGEFQLIDADTRRLEKFSHPGWFDDLYATLDGLLVLRSRRDVSIVEVSRDSGRTWVEIPMLSNARIFAFKDRQTVYAVAPADLKRIPYEYVVMASRDGGATWVTTGSPPEKAMRALFVDPVTGALVAVLSEGGVLQSVDEGRTWTRRELSPLSPIAANPPSGARKSNA